MPFWMWIALTVVQGLGAVALILLAICMIFSLWPFKGLN